MVKSELRAAIAISALKKMTYKVASSLIDIYGSAEAILAQENLILKDEENEREISVFTKDARMGALTYADSEIEFIEREGIKPIFFTENDYPSRLRECDDAPIMLYYRGSADLNSRHMLSIVGTRHATPYGRSFCEKLVSDLATMFPDLIINSGLAYGIDVCAHRAALANGLKTVAVLGHSLNTIYPATHRNTAAQIIENGALITEYTSQTPTLKVNFVARNRIIAGMSDATVVVESKEEGGSLITADLASGYYREVFALPGDIQNETSIGCNNLIKANKASLITSATDIADSLGWKYSSPKKRLTLFPELDETEQKIIDMLNEKRECQVNTITEETGIATSLVISSLMGLEFKGLVRSFPGNRYRKA
ncbi:MAG: DNA-processing protein DprA [Bacteroidales bacterium]